MDEFRTITLVSNGKYCMFNFCLVCLTDDDELKVICDGSLQNLVNLFGLGVSFFQTMAYIKDEQKEGYLFKVPVSFIREMHK